jgi:predicted amidohydrolase YtcJ
MFADGALGPRTAWMLEGFDSAPDSTGISAVPPQELHEAILKANAHGLAATVHAIGDRANREVLDIFAARKLPIGAGVVTARLRNRIEHVQLLRPADACRLAELGVIASMQPLHATSDSTSPTSTGASAASAPMPSGRNRIAAPCWPWILTAR